MAVFVYVYVYGSIDIHACTCISMSMVGPLHVHTCMPMCTCIIYVGLDSIVCGTYVHVP